MNVILTVTRDHIRLLRRDRIFIPALIIGFVLVQIAIGLSEMSIENLDQVMFNFAHLAYTLTGSTIAVLWGSSMISESRKDGSIETILASPISRSSLVIGKFLALIVTLSIFAILVTGFMQASMWMQNFGWLSHNQLFALGFSVMGWFLVAAVALFFSSIAGTSIALFCSGSAWLLGILSSPIYQSMAQQKMNPLTKSVMKYTAYVWDLQRFNLSELIYRDVAIGWRQVSEHFAYGLTTIVFLIVTTCLFMTRRDLVD